MTIERAVDILKNEAECVRRNGVPGCDRKCEKCDLVLEDKDVLTAYIMSINALQRVDRKDIFAE